MLNLVRRTLVAAALGFAALLADQAAAAPFRLITTDLEPPLVPNSVMDLALSLGYFRREGVDVEIVRVQQTPSAAAALQAGEGEMANISVDAALQLVARGRMQLKAVLSPNKSLPYLIAGKDSIASFGDLQGRSFGIGRVGSLDHALSSKVLASHGVDPGRVDFVALGQPGVRAQALAAGRIDATTMSIGVWLSLPDRTGLKVLVPVDDYFAAAPVLNKVNVVPDAVLAARRGEVEAVVRALIRASRDFAARPETWVDTMASARPDVDRATLKMLARSFAGCWSVNGGLNPGELQGTADWLWQGPDFAGLTQPPLAQWVDTSLVADVLRTDGVVPEYDNPGLDGLPPERPVIALRSVSKSFRRGKAAPVAALADVSLEIGRDRFVSLVGPSGCGKTTLLRLIDGLIAPDAGAVLVDGAPPVPGPGIGFVFQSFRLVPWATVADNVGFGLALAGVAEPERRARVARYLELVGLARFADAFPSELAGGMKQRTALARALATEPGILLMDEPFASLDAQTRELMQLELMRIWAGRRGVVVLVTHSVDEAVLLADRVLLMSPRPGRILASFEVPLPRPRWDYDVRARPEFTELRALLWDRIRTMVTTDPASDFYRRGIGD